jgi:hypothetical protein
MTTITADSDILIRNNEFYDNQKARRYWLEQLEKIVSFESTYCAEAEFTFKCLKSPTFWDKVLFRTPVLAVKEHRMIIFGTSVHQDTIMLCVSRAILDRFIRRKPVNEAGEMKFGLWNKQDGNVIHVRYCELRSIHFTPTDQ